MSTTASRGELPQPQGVLVLGPSICIDRILALDALIPEARHDYRHVETRWGGKGLNVALNLAGQAVVTTLLCFDPQGLIASGHTASPMLDLPAFPWPPPQQSAMRMIALPSVQPPRLNLKVHTADADGAVQMTELNEAPPALSPQQGAALLEAVREHIGAHEASVVVASGSLPAGLPPEAYADWLTVAQRAGARTILDARGQAARFALNTGCVSLIKPNREELADLTGQSCASFADAVDAARALARHRRCLVLASLDHEGACLVDAERDETLYAPVPALDRAPRRVIGAGDAMTASLAALFAGCRDASARLPGERLLRRAMASAMATIVLPMGEAASLDDIRAYESRVEIRLVSR